MKRVVVTGIGAITPIGNTVPAYLEGLRNGVSGAAPITLFDASLFKTQFACEVKNFVPEDFIDKREIRRLDRFCHFAMVSADEAVADAGLPQILESLDLDRVGVIWASGVGGLGSLEEEISEFARGNGTPRYNPFMIPKMIADIAAGHISIKYGFRGVNYATVSACASSSHAIINAFDCVRLGRNHIVVCGGSEAAIIKTGVGGFNAMKALSTRNDDYATASRPFDKDRDGFVMGEGGGVIILEEYEHAKKRGAKIYCELAGYGLTADAYHMSAPSPDGEGAARCMAMAMRHAKMNPEEIDYINAHGTSTPVGDVCETKAVKRAFGEHAKKGLAVSSTKSMTGHLLGAAGAVEMAACIMAMRDGVRPPTINLENPDPECDLDYVPNTAREKKIKAAISNSFGFGGHNSSLLIKAI